MIRLTAPVMSNSQHPAAGQIEFLSTCPTTRLQKPDFRIAAHPDCLP